MSRSYDANFQLAALGVNGTEVARFTRDRDGLLTSAGPMQITRDMQTGKVSATTLSRVSTEEQTSALGELLSYSASFRDTVLYSEEILARDRQGRITQRRETVQGTTTEYNYVYDAAGRLSDVILDGAAARHYDYDANGNRMQVSGSAVVSCSYDAQDRLVGCGDEHYEFNAAGQLTRKVRENTATATSYDYDVVGNLRSVTLPNGRIVDYEVDARNRRIGKRVNGVRQWGLLYQNELAPVAQVDSHNAAISTFIYSTRDHVPDFMVKEGRSYRFVVDHVGSVRELVNVATGSVAQRIDYDEFGNVTLDTNPGFQPFGFAGGLYDADTTLVRFGARDYDAQRGRWTAKDPILFRGLSTNLYEYARSNPVNLIDPNGLQAAETMGATAVCGPVCGALAFVGSALVTAGIIVNCSKDGRPGNNQAQNKQFDDAVREIEKRIGRTLGPDERRELHDWIQDLDGDFWDIVSEGVGLFGD